MEHAKGKGTHPWVQPILVAKHGTHEETVRLGAQVSVKVGLAPTLSDADCKAIADWLAGPFTKTVRRASYDQLIKVQDWARANNSAYADAAVNDSAAVALVPMTYEAMPKVVARLQVSGTDLARQGAESVDSLITVAVLDSLSTGKATAQAAHAAWKYALETDSDRVRAALESDFVAVRFVAEEELADLAASANAYAIRDNGLTEVEAQTLTAVAVSS